MLLYYSSLEEKFKVYREQQILNLKAQEDQLMQAMIARDPALAERFIEAKAEAKPEAKQEAKPEAKREAAERSLKKKEDFDVKDEEKRKSPLSVLTPPINPSLFSDLTKKLSSPNKGLKSRESSRANSTNVSPTASEAPTVSSTAASMASTAPDFDLGSKEKVPEFYGRMRDVIKKMNLAKDKKNDFLREFSKQKNNKTKASIDAFIKTVQDEYPDEWQAASISGNGLRTKRCKIHF